MHKALAVISFVIVCSLTIPYIFDIIHGRAKPARATRLMFVVLLVITLLQQNSLNSGYAMAVTIGEIVSCVVLFVLSIRYGVGGFSRIDKICYLLLALNLSIWFLTKNTLLALHLIMVADSIAFWPTLEKTWRDPKSETKLFFVGGVIAPLFSVAAQNEWSYSVVIFPLYLSAINLLEVALISTAHHKSQRRS